jgi:hypothetical protein
MKIIDRKSFLDLPSGVLYSKYRPCTFDALSIKGNTRHGDFNTLLIAETLVSDQPALEDGCERLDRWCRDGLFDQNQWFAVWEKTDVETLVRTLTMANLPGKLGLLEGHAAQRVINLKAFLDLPPGVVFSKYRRDDEAGPLKIKGSSLDHDDFNYQNIEDAIDTDELCYIDACSQAQEQGTRLKLDFECYQRDGNFHPDQHFLVWGSTDVEALIIRLTDLALEGYPDLAEVASGHPPSVD